MWILEDKDGKKIELKGDKSVTVGRNNTDILLSNDASISRSHAKIEVIKKTTNKSKSSINNTQLIITDSKSKYGTFLLKHNRENRIDEKGYIASHMDRIRFGLQQYIFTIIHKPEIKYLVLTSGLTEREKKDLEKILEFLGGKLCNSWDDNCTHLTTCTLGLTEKISCALAAGITIVNIAFWKDVLKAQKVNEDIPDANNYIPPFDNLLRGVGEIALRPNFRRQKIFRSLVFYYFDEYQFKLYSNMIKLAGGKSLMFDESSYKKSGCTRDGVIIVQPLADSESQNRLLLQYQTVNEQLKKNQLRSIPASEIPLAILYCSLDQHCNPKFKYTKLLQSKDKEKHMKVNTEKILVPETQDWDDLPNNNQNVIIPETVPESQPLIMNQQHDDNQSARTMVDRMLNIASKRKEPSSLLDERDANLDKRKKIDGIVKTAKTKDKDAENDKNQSKKRKLESFDSIEEIEIKSESEIKTETEIKKENDVDEISKESVWDVFIGETPESDFTVKTLKDDDTDFDNKNDNENHFQFGQRRRKEESNVRKRPRIEKNHSDHYEDDKKEKISIDSIEIDDVDIEEEFKKRNHSDDDDDNKDDINKDRFSYGQNCREADFALRKKKKVEENKLDQHYEDDKSDSIDIIEFDIKNELEGENNSSYVHGNNSEKVNRDSRGINESIDNNRSHEDNYDDDDNDNDENQFSSNWIKTRRKKNAECRRDSVGEIETESGYKIKFISLTDLQGKHKPLSGKSFCKKNNSSIPIKRLTKEDFYVWVPPAKNL